MDFEKEIHQITTLIPENITLAPETTDIANTALEAVNDRYGPDSDTYLPYHNAPHAVDIARRGVRMVNMLWPYMSPRHRSRMYDLVIVDGATHDYDQDSGPGANEDNSIEYGIELVESFYGVLNTAVFKNRSALGTAATKVEMDENGRLIQTNLRKGSRDPIKFIMAFSDINGIAMEGDKRMLRDATNLYNEITPETSAKGYVDFLVGQAGFLRKRLNDSQIKPDIKHYFPNDARAVYNDMYKAFHPNIISAYNLADFIGKHPELLHVVEKGAQSFDRTGLSKLVGRYTRRMLAANQ